MAGAGAGTSVNIYDLYDVEKDSPHFLLMTFIKLKKAFGDSYKDLRDGIIKMSAKEKSSKSKHGKLDIKLVNLIGVADPTSKTGAAGTFLDNFFHGMSKAQRKAYFAQHYHGDFDNLATELEKMVNANKDAGDKLRVRLNYNDVFAFIGLVGQDSRGGDVDLYHITISIDSEYDVKGQHGNPSGTELKQTVHLTDEDPKKNTHYFFTFDLDPINDAAKKLKFNKTVDILKDSVNQTNIDAILNKPFPTDLDRKTIATLNEPVVVPTVAVAAPAKQTKKNKKKKTKKTKKNGGLRHF